MSRIIRSLLIFIFISPAAFAKNSAHESYADEEFHDLLKGYTNNIEFSLSDAEGLFFEILKKVIKAPQVPAGNSDFYSRDFLSMKAELLNDLIRIIPLIHDQQKLGSIYQM